MRIPILATVVALLWFISTDAARGQDVNPPEPQTYEEVLQQEREREEATEGRTVLNQGDPRWRGLSLGTGTIGDRGCFVAAILMAAADLGLAYGDPFEMFRSFLSNALFTRTGSLYTSAIDRVFPGLRIVERTAASMANLERIEQQLADGHQVLIRLDRRTNRGMRPHWVRVVETVSGDLRVDDPDGGRTILLSAFYGSRAVMREMMVLAH